VKRWDLIVALGVVGAVGAASLTAFTAVTACNTGSGSCPDKAAVLPGASCSDNHLQCAFDLTTPAVACDGRSTVIETSCTCTDGRWACPSAVECDSGADAADEASTDEAGGDDGGDAAISEDAAADAADAADAHD
jgi:hypothetical protein